MPALNFMRMFVEPIRLRLKNHTIRADRAVPIKPGDKLYLYCGMRRKGAFRILLEPVICSRVQRIEMYTTLGILSQNPYFNIDVDGETLSVSEKDRLAKADGFDSIEGMAAFWKRRLPFKGQIIHWRHS